MVRFAEFLFVHRYENEASFVKSLTMCRQNNTQVKLMIGSDSMNKNTSSMSISDEIWEQIEPLTIGNKGTRGGNAEDTRMFIDAVLCILYTGSAWRDLPKEFGSWNTVQRRFSRWRSRGIWEQILEVLICYEEYRWLFVDDRNLTHYKCPWMRMVCRSEALLKLVQNNFTK